MKRTIKDYELNNKKVIIRCDFNVPIKDGKITDDNRIIESIPTIKYALEQGAKVILMSHLGRVKTIEDKLKNTLAPVAKRLSELLQINVTFIAETRGEKLEEAISNVNSGEVILMENTRFEDLDGKKESGNDPELGTYWASLGEIFINDAFGTCHRAHASNVGIGSKLPNGIGFLVEKELNILGKTLEQPDKPFTVILGGAKVSDKIKVIENLVKIADYILVGGGMAYTFLKSQGIEIGASLLDEDSLNFCQQIFEKYPEKIILPIDAVCSKNIESLDLPVTKFITDLSHDDIGLDVGWATTGLFIQYLKDSQTIIWNGPLGMFEKEQYQDGTKKICEYLSKSGKTVIIGGGDTSAAAILFGYKDAFTHISTGGGASLEMMEGKVLPGVEIINER
ncbi:MAG: phosphoglycerate kinase [Firmicutes bacterium]|nr:phosphoglycerate kinase [Bacillota bacterium]